MKIFDLSSYSLHEPLPAGGMTHAHVATRHGTGSVLVKRLHPGYASNPEIRARWLEQVAHAAAFTHPASVRVLDYGTAEEDGYLAVEFIEGVNLMTIIRGLRHSDERLPVDACIHIARVFLDVLAALHAQTPLRLHHDVSTRAIRIATDGSVRITEPSAWGIFPPKRALQERFERGTAVYQSPEQVNGLEPDPRSELFSIGVVLFELLAKERPFQGPNQLAAALLISSGKRPKLRDVAPSVPQALCDVVERLLAQKPEERFQSAADVVAALAAFSVADVRAEFAALVPRFQPNDTLHRRAQRNAPPAPVAGSGPGPLPKPSAGSDEPRTRLGWAIQQPTMEPPPAAAKAPEEKRDEPRTQFFHAPSIVAAAPARQGHDARSDEPRTRLNVPFMTAASAQAAPPVSASAEPRTRMQGLLDLPHHARASAPAGRSTTSQTSASMAPASEPVFGGAASDSVPAPHYAPPPVQQPPLPPPEMPRSPAEAPYAAPVPPPELLPLPGAPPLISAAPPRIEAPEPPLLSTHAAPPEHMAAASPVAPSPAPSAPRPEPMDAPVPMVSDGKTAFLDRNALRAGVSSSTAAEDSPKASAPALVVAPLQPSHMAQAHERGLPELVSSVEMPASLGAPGPDRGWKDPSQTLFRAKTYAADPTRREKARIPLALMVALAFVFGFALLAGGYLLLRLMN